MTFDRQFLDKEYRDAYADTFLDTWIATQLRVLREQRELTQAQLAERAGMKQSRISTMEDVNYSNWSIQTLKRLAHALDVPLFVSWGEWSGLIENADKFSRAHLQRPGFNEEHSFSNHSEIEVVESAGVSVDVKNTNVVYATFGAMNRLQNVA